MAVAAARSASARTAAGPATTPVTAVLTAIVAPIEAIPMGPLRKAVRKNADIDQHYLLQASTGVAAAAGARLEFAALGTPLLWAALQYRKMCRVVR